MSKSEEKRKLVYMLSALEEMLEKNYADIDFTHKNVSANLELLTPSTSDNIVVFTVKNRISSI